MPSFAGTRHLPFVETSMHLRYLVCFVTVAFILTGIHADNWPQWRGPMGDGISKETGVPDKWSKEENILWSVPLPGMGGSTPIIWGDKLFLTTENKEKMLALMCFSTKDGKELWSKPLSTKKAGRARGDEGNS